MRVDFKAAVAACLIHEDGEVRKVALSVVLPSRVKAGYAILAAELAKQFPKYRRGGQTENVIEGGMELRYPAHFISTFGILGDSAIPVLLEQLKSDSAVARYVAVTLLGRSGNRRVTKAIAALLKDPSDDVRRRAIKALGILGGKDAIDALAAMANSRDEQIAEHVAIALSANRDERAIRIWTRLLREGKGKYAGFYAGRWLREFPLKQSVPLLIEALSHRTRYVRSTAHKSLTMLTCRDFGYSAGRDGDDKETAARRQKAIRAWSKWWDENKDKDRYQILLTALKHNQSGDVLDDLKARTFLSLVYLGDTRAIPGLLKLYDNNIKAIVPNEALNVPWVLRNLAGRHFDDKAAWGQWLAKEGKNLPKKSTLSRPYNPLRIVARATIAWTAEHVAIDGELAFVGTRCALEVFDISNRRAPEIIGHYDLRGECQGVGQLLVRKGRMFLSTHAGGVSRVPIRPAGQY